MISSAIYVMSSAICDVLCVFSFPPLSLSLSSLLLIEHVVQIHTHQQLNPLSVRYYTYYKCIEIRSYVYT